jgi:uncharacterized protein (TIGR03790 family)
MNRTSGPGRPAFRATIELVLLPVLLLLAAPAARAQSADQVLLVVNRRSEDSLRIAEYYRPRRSVPLTNVCYLETTAEEEITWETYLEQIERPVAACLANGGLRDKILYITTTLGVPLKVTGGGSGPSAEYASVDSELALLYGKMTGSKFPRAGVVPNPFFMQRDAPFQHSRFPIYLVTRLAAWDLDDVKAMIDRSLAARNRGKFVIDSRGGNSDGDTWLRNAAMLLPKARVTFDDTEDVLYGRHDVIGYASWGGNDPGRKRRWLRFQWLPGAIATEFVSTDARTLKRPPDAWTFGGPTWDDPAHMFGTSAQSLSADYIHEGATGVSGNAYEPFLKGCVRPDYLLPAYYQGRTLAESYYLALPFLSWMGVVLGDPLCSLGKP